MRFKIGNQIVECSIEDALRIAPSATECTALLLRAQAKLTNASNKTRRSWKRAHDQRLMELKA